MEDVVRNVPNLKRRRLAGCQQKPTKPTAGLNLLLWSVNTYVLTVGGVGQIAGCLCSGTSTTTMEAGTDLFQQNPDASKNVTSESIPVFNPPTENELCDGNVLDATFSYNETSVKARVINNLPSLLNAAL
jgi:hypothetical protein